ncbi:MAG: dihydropyrimidinase [Kiloniellales bacterium]
MAEFDLVIRNGTVATAADSVRCDVGVRDGKVAALGTSLDGGGRVIDAAGNLVLPGGVDSHCHIAQKGSLGVETADDFRSGSISAACGGTTTIIPFAAQYKGQSLRQVVDAYHARAEGQSVIDYAFHLIISDPSDQLLGQDLPALIREGLTSFKVYMTYDALRLDDAEMLGVLAAARREGAMVMVHAENHEVIAWLTERLLAAGHTAPKFHAVAHAAPAEREATHRAITLSEIVDVPLLIVHVSGREAIDEIAEAQRRGLRIYGETCPQYLFLSADDMDRPGFEGAKYVCSPPPRDAANQEFVWRGITSGVLSVFSSDHAAYRFDDPRGKKLGGEKVPFKRIPNGVPGLEIRLPMLFSEGVGGGRISLNHFVALTATNPARIYGLYPRKGTIAVGADADIAIWDPELEVVIGADMLHDNMDYTPYEGRRVTGWPVITLSRGEVVWDGKAPRGEPGRGRFLACDLPDAARPRGAFVSGFDPATGQFAGPVAGQGSGTARSRP